MTSPELAELLTAAAGARGAASASVIAHAGAEPVTSWVSDSSDEPAFLAYSITKTILAALVLQLCEEQRLDLDDRLDRWYPRVDRAGLISIRQLLNHTAGIPDYGSLAAYSDDVRTSPANPWPFERFAAETFDKELSFEPGNGWAYSNPGYLLVRRIAEEASGMSLRSLVSERIARPLGLRRTFVPESIEDLAGLALGVSQALSPDRSPRDVRQYYHPGWVSHGVVASTASEIVRFIDRLLTARFISRSSLDQMTELVTVPVEPPKHVGKPSYGLGLMGDPASRWGLLLGHNGGGPGYSASVFHAVEPGGVSACVMAAIEDDFDPMGVVFEILEHLESARETEGGHR